MVANDDWFVVKNEVTIDQMPKVTADLKVTLSVIFKQNVVK